MAIDAASSRGQLTAADVWRKARLAVDANRPRAAQAGGRRSLGRAARRRSASSIDNPTRYLAAQGAGDQRARQRRADHAGADARWPPPTRGVAALQSRRWEEAAAAASWPPGPGPTIGKQTRAEAAADAGDHYERAAQLGASGRRPAHRLARRDAGLEGARRAAQPRRAAPPLAAGAAGRSSAMSAEPSSATRPGSTGRRAR